MAEFQKFMFEQIVSGDASNNFASRVYSLTKMIQKWAPWRRDIMNVFMILG